MTEIQGEVDLTVMSTEKRKGEEELMCTALSLLSFLSAVAVNVLLSPVLHNHILTHFASPLLSIT